MTKILHILGISHLKFLFFLRNHLHSLENLQKFDYIIAGGGGAACHLLCQFMPAVSETKDYAEHFGI